MFVSILVSAALLIVCPVLAIITLPNGFTFDETKILRVDSRASSAPENCEAGNDGCSNDCSAQLTCNDLGKVQDRSECGLYSPYCVKNADPFTRCSTVFPMEAGACLTKALNYLVCTDDGIYPDPYDCTKYHVCNGAAHYVETCPPNYEFTYDFMDPNTIRDRYVYPGNGQYKCRFHSRHASCSMCQTFQCEGMANQFTFRNDDHFHYAYCIGIGTTKRIMMFKCPEGTRHPGVINSTTNSVDCIPIAKAP